MFVQTLTYLACPDCKSERLTLHPDQTLKGDVRSGRVSCDECTESFPIHEGVLIWMSHPDGYLREHVTERDSGEQHIDESLESDRVTALYWLGHYVSARELLASQPKMSAALKALIKKYWDHGPMQRLAKLFRSEKYLGSLLEIGCGSGGLSQILGSQVTSYLGIDTSYQGVARAREILLKDRNEYPAPGDLIHGSLSASIRAGTRARPPKDCDFIVMDAEAGGLKSKQWDFVAAFNVIDMLHEPRQLFQLQKNLLTDRGLAISSSPYIWHPATARSLKPKKGESSPDRVIRLAKAEGFLKILHDVRDIPWLFFKNINQIEIYNVHLLVVRRGK